MQYSHYPSVAHQVHPATQSPSDYASSYSEDPSHHSTISYAGVAPASHMHPTHQNISSQYPYPSYTAQSSADEHRSYYTTSQGATVDQYTSPSSPTNTHHNHMSHQQSQTHFIPTPSQTYQVYSSSGSTASSARSRSTVEPYYHMSPNPQHVTHASPAPPTHGSSIGGRNSTAHGSGSSHSHHGNTHTGTISVAAGERYPCDLCDRSFTRLHDRRRHYETVHATSPVLHKCRFCRKDFSRADSLKRHVDNGCDEMPR